MIRIKRSGGPKTAEGKAITSRNAIKTGAYSATVVLPGESEAEFKELADQFFHDFPPRDAVEASMVREMALLDWKKRRLERLESAGHARELDRPIQGDELANVGVYLPAGCEHILANLSMLTQEFVSEQVEIRNSILELQSVALTEEVIKEIPANHGAFYSSMCLLARRYWDVRATDLAIAKLARHRIREGKPDEERFMMVALRELLDIAKQVLAVHYQLDAIRCAIPKIKDRRLLFHVQSDEVDRAHDYLRQAFSRTAAEWRRHRKWRQENGTYDVTPNPDGSITI